MNSKTRHILPLLAVTLTALLLCACSESPEMPGITDADEDLPCVEVPLTLEINSGWCVDVDDEGLPDDPDATRATPGNATGTWVSGEDDVANLDMVRILAFRRKSLSEGASGEDTTPFIYDRSNDKSWPITGAESVGDHNLAHTHPYAQAVVKKVYGYEYKIVAIAYSSTRKLPYCDIAEWKNSSNEYVAQQLLNLINAGQFITPAGHPCGEEYFYTTEGTTFDDFKARLVVQDIANKSGYWSDYLTGGDRYTHKTKSLSGKAVAVPQFFWGQIFEVGSTDPVIKYMTTNAEGDGVTTTPLTGMLYRGTARLQIRIGARVQHDGHSLAWLVLMADNVYSGVNLSSYDAFKQGTDRLGSDNSYTAIGGAGIASLSGEITIDAWILPCATRLALRGYTPSGAAADHVFNGQMKAPNSMSTGAGTGIISPEVKDNVFYLQRNHKYVIYATDTETIFKSDNVLD